MDNREPTYRHVRALNPEPGVPPGEERAGPIPACDCDDHCACDDICGIDAQDNCGLWG